MRSNVQIKIEHLRECAVAGLNCQITLTNAARFNVAGVRSVKAHAVSLQLTDASELLIAPEDIVSVRISRPNPLVSA